MKKWGIALITLVMLLSTFISTFAPSLNVVNAANIVPEMSLSNPNNGQTSLSTTFSINDRVRVCTSGNLWVHNPDVGNRLWVAPDYCTGVITGGPKIVSGLTYWWIKWDVGKEGWSAEGEGGSYYIEKYSLDYPVADSFDYPLENTWVGLSAFGVLNGGRYHLGVDVCADAGTLVHASAAGRVRYAQVYSGLLENYGGVVIIEHLLPDGSSVCTIYMYLGSINVSVGDLVTKGYCIGEIAPNDCSSGLCFPTRLHFGIFKGGFIPTEVQYVEMNDFSIEGHFFYSDYSWGRWKKTDNRWVCSPEQYREMWCDPEPFLKTHFPTTVGLVATKIREHAEYPQVIVYVDGQEYKIVTLDNYIDPESLDTPLSQHYTPVEVYTDANWNPVSSIITIQQIELIEKARAVQDNINLRLSAEDAIESIDYRLRLHQWLKFGQTSLGVLSEALGIALCSYWAGGISAAQLVSKIGTWTTNEIIEKVADPVKLLEVWVYGNLNTAKKDYKFFLDQSSEIVNNSSARTYLKNYYTAEALDFCGRRLLDDLDHIDNSYKDDIAMFAANLVKSVIGQVTPDISKYLNAFLLTCDKLETIPMIQDAAHRQEEAISNAESRLSPNLNVHGKYTLQLAQHHEEVFTIPDLTLNPGQIDVNLLSAKAGDKIQVSFTVQNIGNASSGQFTNLVSLDPDDKYGIEIPLGTFDMDTLDPDVSRTSTVEVTIPRNVQPGSYYVTVFTDALQVVQEKEDLGLSLDNNIGSTTPHKLSVQAPDMIDLTVTSVEAPVIAGSEGSVTVKYTIKNCGTSPSGPFTNGIYLGETLGSASLLLDYSTSDSVSGGASTTVTKTIYIF